MPTLEDVLRDLLETTRASRVTLRRDVPGEQPFPVVEEVLAPGVESIREETSVHLPSQPVVLEVKRGVQVVQDDSARAYDDPAFLRMLEAYGGLAAQIVTPVCATGGSRGSCRSTSSERRGRGRPRRSRRPRRAAERIGELL